MEFIDRQSKYPNRVLITPENGAPYYATVVRADEPTEAGTPLTAGVFNEAFASHTHAAEKVGYSYNGNFKPSVASMEPIGANNLVVQGEEHRFGNLVVLTLNVSFTPTGNAVHFTLSSVPSAAREVTQVISFKRVEFLNVRVSNDSTVDENLQVSISEVEGNPFEYSEYSFDIVLVYSAK